MRRMLYLSHCYLNYAKYIKILCLDSVELISGCGGRGEVVCLTCNADQEPGFYKENQMSPCPACHERGLIAHRDGSDTM